MKDRTNLAAGILEICGYLFFPIGILLGLGIASTGSHWFGIMLLTVGITLGIINLLAARWLRNGENRGWYTGIILCGLFLPSLFFPFAAVGIWALLSAGTKGKFLKHKQ